MATKVSIPHLLQYSPPELQTAAAAITNSQRGAAAGEGGGEAISALIGLNK